MQADLELYIDVVNARLVQGINSAEAFALPRFFQGGLVPIKIFLLRPIPGAVSLPRFSLVAIDSVSLRLSIGTRAGADALVAFQDTWAKQIAADASGKSQYFYASLNLNTVELYAALGSADEISRYVEVQINEGGGWRPVSSDQARIVASVRDPSGAASLPSPAASYPTWEEANNVYLRKLAFDGDRIVLQVGTKAVEIVVNPDGSVGLNSIGL